MKTETNYWVVLGSHDAAAIGSTSWEKKHGKAVWYVFRSVPGAGGVYVASGAVRSHRNPQVSHPPFGLPARSWMPPGLREKRTQEPNRRTPHPCWMRRSVFRSRPDTTEPDFNRQTSTRQTARRVGSSAQSLVFPFLRQRCQGVGWIHPVNR